MNLAVVFVSYRDNQGEGVPVQRLMDHFAWNGDIYLSYGDRICVYVVSEIGHDLPSYAQCVVFPMDRLPVVEGQMRFSITMTKNAGINQAIADGADVVISTDVDIAFSPDAFQRMTDAKPSEAIIPIYRMAEDQYGSGATIVDGCMGTVAMTADNWRRLQYDNDCVGYGGDDGVLFRDIERAGLDVVRTSRITHVAHIKGDAYRAPGCGSSSCHGRTNGFNFDNFRANRRLHGEKGRKR